MLENGAESHTSGARFVRRILRTPDSLAIKEPARKLDKIIARIFDFGNDQKDNDKQNAFDSKPIQQIKSQTNISTGSTTTNEIEAIL